MHAGDDQLSADLLTDLKSLHKDGFRNDLDPARVPALAELSKELSKLSPCGEAVRHVLTLAIGDSARQLIHTINKSHADIVKGLTALFGLAPHSPEKLEKRRSLAALHLNYSSGDSLRHGKRKDKKFEEVICDHIVTRLIEVGEEHDFSYSRRFVSVVSAKLEESPAQKVDRQVLDRTASTADTHNLLRNVRSDLSRLCVNGLSPKSTAPVITTLVYLDAELDDSSSGRANSLERLGSCCSPEALEIFLLIAIRELPDGDVQDAAIELLGLGQPWRQLALKDRRNRAAACLSEENGDSFYFRGTEGRLLDRIAERIVTRGIDIDQRRAKVG